MIIEPRERIIWEGGRLKSVRKVLLDQRSDDAHDSRRIVGGRMSSWTGMDGVDKAFGSHPSAMHGLRTSLR